MSAVFYRDFGAAYPQAVRGSGMYLFDAEGRRYLDMSGGAAVSPVGHANKRVVAAVREQVRELAFAHTAFFTNRPQEALAERLAARFSEAGARVCFLSGGSEANETAMKLSWQYWRASGRRSKRVVISRQSSYHGSTLGALSVSGSRFRRASFEGVLHDWPRIAPCYAYRHREPGESEEAYGRRVADELETAILAVGAENVAAFIAEPVVGATLGAVPAVTGYLQRIRSICDQYDVLFIADEVMCGAGRTGTYFAHAADAVVPDLVTLAKGVGGGYQPLGAVLMRGKIAEGVEAGGSFASGHTYIGHATACAAGLAVQECLDEEGLLGHVPVQGDAFRSALVERFGAHPFVGDIRGRGLFVGIEFVLDRSARTPIPATDRVPARLKAAAMESGVICYPGGGTADGVNGAHVLFAPPFILESAHIDECCERFSTALDSVFATAT